MEEFKCYAIDFEGSLTTGILEYGVVEISSKQGICAVQTHLCKNRREIPEEERNCHGISANQLDQCLDFSAYLPQFMAWRSQNLFCSHNAIFEDSLLTYYCPVVFQAKTYLNYEKRCWGPWLDTYNLYRRCFPNRDNTLQTLIKMHHLEQLLFDLGKKLCPHTRNKFHCALFDALACALLLLNFIKQEDFNSKTFAWLLQKSSSRELQQQLQQKTLF